MTNLTTEQQATCDRLAFEARERALEVRAEEAEADALYWLTVAFGGESLTVTGDAVLVDRRNGRPVVTVGEVANG